MEWIVDFFMDFVVDVLVEVISELFPNKKLSTKAFKWQKRIAAVVTVVFILLLVIGICMVGETEGKSVLGKVFIALLPAEILVLIILNIIRSIRKKGK